jgi:hypothetical protein
MIIRIVGKILQKQNGVGFLITKPKEDFRMRRIRKLQKSFLAMMFVFVLIITSSLMVTLYAYEAIPADNYELNFPYSGTIAAPAPPDELTGRIDERLVRQPMERSPSAFGFVRVDVHMVADQLWRNANGGTNWAAETGRQVLVGTDIYFRMFSVDMQRRGATAWNSPNTRYGNELLSHARINHGLNGHQLMMAFTGRQGVLWHPGNPIHIAGLAELNGPHALTVNFGASNNHTIIRHEIGHNYGLSHCTASCFMNGTNPYPHFDSMCNAHRTQFMNNRNRY